MAENLIERLRAKKTHMSYGLDRVEQKLPASDLELEAAAAIEDLVLSLQGLLEAYSKPDERLCCDGRDCGCMGSTVHQQAEHYARAAIAKATGVQ
ncbi:hypothetical protein [Agrobacterium tumefaciens]|uniref:hypothetical protein n=1 Tax=Agrobacterium tumefaciens TaxID=358 RepID=UPI0021D396DA|nr:hypothetical protein [Agrobacterium tumefaciens]UXS24234.1 hypothetical protein FY153_07105 [Agrobacterium tumefaciens]UXS52400.1 hypothetical protein FY148_06910 [Agrobacterium tumefaciens]UXS62646.1 hypothetical protein FY147_06910 [Agrobacterium tumefaciens]